MGRPYAVLLTGSALSAALLVLLGHVFELDFEAIASTLGSVPRPVYLAVAALEFLNLLAGAQKWRVSAGYFQPGAARPSLLESLEATALGSLFGQILPAQVGTAAARAAFGARRNGAGMAVWTTIHEQLFDLVALCAVGAAAGLAFAARLEPTTAAALGTVAVLAGFVSAQGAFALGARAAAWLPAASPRFQAFPLSAPARTLAQAASAPWRVPAALLALSLVRLALMAGRALIVCAAILPAASLYVVALGFPAVQLLTSVPAAPGGLGIAEWSWTGVLSSAGAPAQQAAEAAIVIRLVALAAFALVLAAVFARRLLAR